MAFEYRKFEESDKALYDSWGIKSPLSSSFTYPDSWVADVENDIYLVSFGGRGSDWSNEDNPPNFFALIFKEHPVNFEGRYKSTYPKIGESELWWLMDSISIPMNLKSSEALVKEQVKNSIHAYWTGMENSGQFPSSIVSITIEYARTTFK